MTATSFGGRGYNRVMKHKQNTDGRFFVDSRFGGYSDPRLWPCYMLFTASILILAPFIGFALALLAVSVPSFIIALKVAKATANNVSSPRYDLDSWSRDIVKADIAGQPLPQMTAYEILEPVAQQPSVVVTPLVMPKLHLFKRHKPLLHSA